MLRRWIRWRWTEALARICFIFRIRSFFEFYRWWIFWNFKRRRWIDVFHSDIVCTTFSITQYSFVDFRRNIDLRWRIFHWTRYFLVTWKRKRNLSMSMLMIQDNYSNSNRGGAQFCSSVFKSAPTYVLPKRNHRASIEQRWNESRQTYLAMLC